MRVRAVLEEWPDRVRQRISAAQVIRISLGTVYLWFGALKVVNVTPVLGLIRDLCPWLVAIPVYCLLTAFEVGVGLILLLGRWTRPAALLVTLHLLGTFSVLLVLPGRVFEPVFPVLTLEGEFVVKNLVLLAAAFALWIGLDRGSESASDGRDRRPRSRSRKGQE